MKITHTACAALLSLGFAAGAPAWAQSQTQTYSIETEALGAALQHFAAQASLQLMFSESDVAGLQAPGLQGTLTQDQALTQLLAGSGLKYEFFKPGAVIIKRAAATPAPPTAQ